MGRRAYQVHRWLGLIVGLQLFLWSAGGLVFATHDIAWVRGERGKASEDEAALRFDTVVVTPAQAAVNSNLPDVSAVELRSLLGRAVYRVANAETKVLVDARAGEVLSPIGRDTATAIAEADRDPTPAVRATEWLQEAPVEYRGRPLPVWRVSFEGDENLRLYVDPRDGTVTARRNDAWRRFDLFWMLHTMDYQGRDDFNHGLLIVVAALGLVSVGSGWFLLLSRWLRRRKSRAPKVRA